MNHHTKIKIGILAIAIAIFLILVLTPPKAIAPNVVGPNYKNVTVQTNLTITSSKPDMMNVTVYDATNSSLINVTLNAGGSKQIYCNGSVRNWQGTNDITLVRAVLWHNATSNYTAANNTNNHYSNSSCFLNSTTGAFTAWYACSFNVSYHANNGTWVCNMTVENSYTANNSNFTGSALNYTQFYPVYALNVTDGIDYGGVAVEDFSSDRQANITNLGNMHIGVSVEGYGATRGDGFAMICNLTGNITVDNERFSNQSGTLFAAKTPLTSNLGGVNISGLNITKTTNASAPTMSTTYWQIYVPPNPAGNCTGYIIFTAVATP
ncbi:MAG TPA: hypothetical protein VEC16_05070 [Alphaproteobacteria bacterium]|nr:hypothetical protein [Alphaproteobacteria bacterium]